MLNTSKKTGESVRSTCLIDRLVTCQHYISTRDQSPDSKTAQDSVRLLNHLKSALLNLSQASSSYY